MLSRVKQILKTKIKKEHIHWHMLNKHLHFKNKKVLEIGCGEGDLTKYIARNKGVDYIIGTDYDLKMWGKKPQKEDKWQILSADARNLMFEDNTFDICFSIGVFEHINGLDAALNEINRVLKPNGLCYAYFEPIWTSIIGHHFYFWIKEDLWLLPPWGHLFMTAQEMHDYIINIQKRDVDFANKAVKWIYESDIINRTTRTEYFSFINENPMSVTFLRELQRVHRQNKAVNEFNNLTDGQQDVLLKKYTKRELFVGGFELVMQKQ